MSNGNANGGRTILILGGTGPARALADTLVEAGYDVVTSLAGRTSSPRLPKGRIRTGGFGGVDGLAAAIANLDASVVVDATHPYAAQISANAVAACKVKNVPLIRLERALWPRPEGANWISAASAAEAASIVPLGARAFLAIGRQEAHAFFSRSDCMIVARMIEEPEGIPKNWTVIRETGPFALEDELALFEAHAITHLVCKNSGGEATRAKIDAAAQLGIPIIMIERPALPDAKSAETVQETLDFIAELFRTGTD